MTRQSQPQLAPPHKRVSKECAEHEGEWNWLYDSWEGGERYRNASYGSLGRFPRHNLRRHKREVPDGPGDATSPVISFNGIPVSAGGDPFADDFEMRRDRTPPPDWVSSAVEAHLSRLYSKEVKRKGPPLLDAFWKDVDGRGSSIDEWMPGHVAPLLFALGQLDIWVDRPADPDDGTIIRSNGDEQALNALQPVASYILPQNVRWWKLDRRGKYIEVVVREFDEEGVVTFRHWTRTGWVLYSASGKVIEDRPSHGYDGFIPIERVFWRRKPRCTHVGMSFYATIAYLQREYYNRDSELILSDTLQAHPLLQGPEDIFTADGEATVGPNWMLAKKKNETGGSVSYEGYEAVEFPKDGAESIRLNKTDLRDSADRSAMLTKPAGVAGSTGSTVAQSGYSKELDQDQGNKLLAKFAAKLEGVERTLAGLVEVVGGGAEGAASVAEPAVEPATKPADSADLSTSPTASIEVVYPREFDLATPQELAKAISAYQAACKGAGATPKFDAEALKALSRVILKGKTDAQYAVYDREIDAFVKSAATDLKARRTAETQTIQNQAKGLTEAPSTPNSKGDA